MTGTSAASATSSSGVEVLRYAAFTTDPSGGNPAGVVCEAEGLADADMLAVAAEVGYSETAFVTGGDSQRRRFRLRYFSPKAEVAFCGHATVATSVELGRRLGPGRLDFTTNAGEISVDVTASGGDVPRATLTSVPTSSREAGDAVVDAALAALRWSRADLDPRFPPHVAFGGNDHLVLAAASRERLADLDYDFDALGDLMRAEGWTTVHLFCPGEPGEFHARNPFPVGGVVEDAATGAAAAAFGGYLRQLGYVTAATTYLVHQGEDMGRPSELRVEVDPADPRVRVSGQAVVIPA
ncbi:PhzF family phenazine biosynthesis isomerase [Saccharomonospora xinjiangensis]|uniref:Phenazine biosynthesis protein PhzF family n=1 Tax=Saccharomonospora xinjiangensis XJ-54 TaxID=882086 RepID=I0V8U2_9PSEU|nr:PhzF family phenazine biosynthesis isomerase [Saccharomonospora xinjiangensis]EID56545.1 phenazine biosynthesis protein PhzF family [Saccharomonospora xinjiangensis XJ-54]